MRTHVKARLRRRGYSLVEVLMTMTILGVIGAAMTKLMLNQTRFSDQQNALRSARGVARSSLNILMSDIRMVQDSGGIDSAATDGKLIRVIVPYRFGLYCGVVASKNVLSMLPIDSVMLAQAKYAGYAWRNNVGRYTVVYPDAPLAADSVRPSTNATQCTGNAAGQAQIISTSIAGRAGAEVENTPSITTPSKGGAVFFFQRITYAFGASTAFPGQQGLFRTVQGGTAEEIVAPFDTSAGFQFWQAGSETPVATPPALGDIRGIEVILAGQSTYTPQGRTARSNAKLVTSMFFKNVRSY